MFALKGLEVRCYSISAAISDLVVESQGGALVNLIHSYTDNGDPFVRKFTDQLLEEVCLPVSG